MSKRRIPDCKRIRVVYGGVMLTTTAGLLRQGAMSEVFWRAFRDLEEAHRASGASGRLADFWYPAQGRYVTIQLDIVE